MVVIKNTIHIYMAKIQMMGFSVIGKHAEICNVSTLQYRPEDYKAILD